MNGMPSPCRRWPLEGVANFRDLGGYPCHGGVTRYGVFFRSAHLNAATAKDAQILSEAGISTIVDLRYPDESMTFPDREIPGSAVINCSIMGEIAADKIAVNNSVRDTRTMIRMYRQILEFGKLGLASALRCLLNAQDAAVFHCAAGKDRTGIIAMFLLGIAGVSREDIIADYEVSHTYIHDFTKDISGSHYSNMEKILKELDDRYGGLVPYLYALGISEEEIVGLRGKIVDISPNYSFRLTF